MHKVKLKEILQVTRGMSLLGKYYSTTGKYIRLTLGNFNYPNMGFKLNTAKENIYYTGNVKPEYILKKNDIITPLTEQVKGLLGETAFIPANDLFIQSGDIALVQPIQNKSDANYIYYLISSKIIKNQLMTSSQQTKIRHTSPKYIMNCYAFIPNLDEQKKIGALLRKVDEFILLNKKINSELEQTAKTLYNYWFVQFDFPDENGRPYKSSGGKMVWNEELKKEIPEGWEVKCIKDIAKTDTKNIIPTHNVLYKYYSLPSVSKNKSYIEEYGNNILSSKYIINHYCILVNKLNPLDSRVIFIPNENNQICSTEFIVLQQENNFLRSYIYSILCSEHFKIYCKQRISGAIHKRVAPKLVYNYKIPYNENIVNQYGYIVYNILFKINNAIQENQELNSLRDFLLPLLMNGQALIKE